VTRTALTVPVYYDFASTLSCVAHRVMQRMGADIDDLGIELEWRPLDLSRITGWRRGVVVEGPRRDNALRVCRELQVPLRMPVRWLDSRPAAAVALALRGTTKEPAWRERVWTAVFDEGCDLYGADELGRLGGDIEIDAQALADESRFDQLASETRIAQEAGVTGVPTFILGDWPMGGIQEDATMRALFKKFVAKQGHVDKRAHTVSRA